MPYDGSGNFTSVAAPAFPAISGTTIVAAYYNSVINDLMTNGLSQVITRNGQSIISADIPWGAKKITGLATATAATDAANLGNITTAISSALAPYALIASPTFTGTPLAPNAAVDTNTTQIATTAFMIGQGSITAPLMNGVAAIGTSFRFARAEHVHPVDTSRAPLASPAFTGVATVGGLNVAIGLQTTGQQVISTTSTLTSANFGTNILATTSGIVLTLPTAGSAGKIISISNTSGGDITLSYTGSTNADGPTVIATGTSLMLISDGSVGSFWRAFFASGAYDGTKLFDSGFKDIPQNLKTAAYTLALIDRGKQISINTGGITIPANATVAFPIGSTVVVYNNNATAQTIAITTDSLRQAGTANVGTRTLAGFGLATLVKVDAVTWVISGAGIS